MKKICSQCQQIKPIQRFNTCVECLRKSDKIRRNMIKNGTLSKKKVVVDNSLMGKMKSDVFLRNAFNFIAASKAQEKALGFIVKNDMDFTVYELALRLKDTKDCEECGVELNYNDILDSNSAKKGSEVSDHVAHLVHIIPVSDGGKLKTDNLKVICESCNLSKKGDR